MRTHDEINHNINKTLREIFLKTDDFESLSTYEMRYRIFKHLTRSLRYDYETLDRIKSGIEEHKRTRRNPQEEFQNVVFNKVGICNAISQFYKLLLEKVGIKSYCVICDDGTSVCHQLNLVYDEENDCYSFDDITSVIVGRGTEKEYFDYDLEFAHSVNQGNKDVMNNQNYLLLWEDYVNFVAMRKCSPYKTLQHIPSNISSIKSRADRLLHD